MATEDIFRAACVQLRSSRDMEASLDAAEQYIREAAAAGAVFVATPENTNIMELRTKALFAAIHRQEDDPGLKRFQALADALNIWLLIGSLAIRVSDTQAANRQFLLSPEGGIVSTYDKVHMFDVDLANGESYRESKNFAAGRQAVTADLPWLTLGHSICYDLRFAYQYRLLAQNGAGLLVVPAAFTKRTGLAHWHILLRARAIETGCFVMAPAQGGLHDNGRETFGHSLIIAPWGEILSESGEDPGFIVADIDPALIQAARDQVPALQHDRDIVVEKP